MTLTRQDVAAARDDVGTFAELLVGAPLWPHQLDLARCDSRIAAVCSGRQSGKTRAIAVMCLHSAFAAPERRVLIVSAGESASKDVLREVSMLATSPILSGSVVDDERHQVTLSNGSTIRAVPASPRQIRGQSIDLLVIDEAAYVDESVWTAAKYATIARPGSRVVLSSTPWGRRDGWFSVAYRAGERHETGHESFCWPSTASPLVDADILDIWRQSSSDREYRREVLAEWVDAQGAYFSDDDIETALCDYELIPPDDAKGCRGVAGVDWGFARDSSAVVVLAESRRGDLPGDWPERTFWLPWIDEGIGVPYATFVLRVLDVVKGYKVSRLATETNGVGAMPSQELQRLAGRHAGRIVEVNTTSATKEDGFGRLKVLLSQGRLALPRHPRLLTQLSALEFEERDSGTVRIEVPERAGHDDILMALMLATGVGDVASKKDTLTMHVARAQIPTAPADPRNPRSGFFRKMRVEGEPSPPIVKPGEPRPVEKLLRFENARRHPNYRP
jgi:hypothetical protein